MIYHRCHADDRISGTDQLYAARLSTVHFNHHTFCFTLLHGFVVLLLFITETRAQAETELPSYETKYYIIHTDLDSDGQREAVMRMTRMAEEYYERTKDFSGGIRQKLPFYLYSKQEDYLANGGREGTAGFFDGEKLAALAKDLGPATWKTVQHEGFHQFAHFMIRGELPVWVNEGLAEYFGEGIFTGDEFIVGVIPQGRLDRIQKALKTNGYKPLENMMQLSHAEWNSEMAAANYDQGWSMVQFLVHGNNGKYCQPFASFIEDLGQGRQWDGAWEKEFGGTEGFEKVWRSYWIKLPVNPTIDLFVRANVSTFTGFLARAFSQQQKFASFDEFIAAANDLKLKSHQADWLPPNLLKNAIEQQKILSKHDFKYELKSIPRDPVPQLICTLPDGRKVIGRFTTRMGRVVLVKTDVLGKAATIR